MFFLTGIVIYPITKLVFSLSGANDFLSAGNHLLNLRFRKSISSTLSGCVRLSLTSALFYFVKESISGANKRSNIEKVSDLTSMSVFESARHLQDGAFVNGSKAEKMAKFCQHYFLDSSLNNYEIAYYCIHPLLERVNEEPFKSWMKFPCNIVYRTTQNNLLKTCIEQNRDNGTRYDPNSSAYFKREKLSACDQRLVNFLKELLKQKNQAANVMLNQGCFTSYGVDRCLRAGNEAERACRLITRN